MMLIDNRKNEDMDECNYLKNNNKIIQLEKKNNLIDSIQKKFFELSEGKNFI